MQLWQIGAGSGTELFPLTETDGYEFVGDQKVSYWHQWGRYDELVPAESPRIANPPECVQATQIGMTQNRMTRRSMASLFEAVDCDEAPQLTQSDYEQQRQRLYSRLGL